MIPKVSLFDIRSIYSLNKTKVTATRIHPSMTSLFTSICALHQRCIPQGCRSFSSSFFAYTSGRARRRRELQRLKRQKKLSNIPALQKAEKDADTRTVADILFPNPYKGEPNPYASSALRFDSFASFRKAFSIAWVEYKRTWEGFFSSSGFLVEEKTEKNTAEAKQEEPGETEIERTGKKIQKNLSQNVSFLQEETETLRNEVKERTGIRSSEDLKELAREMMRLASDCVAEFLAGYRKGRDDEVEKMLTEYFKDLQEKANKPAEKRRRAKRRVLTV